jgi:hypothetical protein
MAEGIMGLMDSMPDEGPPADAGDINSPNFGKGMSVPQMYEILEPLARQISEMTGEPVQSVLQEMITDPTAIGRAQNMLARPEGFMDPTTPFPNNLRMPSEEMMIEQGLMTDIPDVPLQKPNRAERLLQGQLMGEREV